MNNYTDVMADTGNVFSIQYSSSLFVPTNPSDAEYLLICPVQLADIIGRVIVRELLPRYTLGLRSMTSLPSNTVTFDRQLPAQHNGQGIALNLLSTPLFLCNIEQPHCLHRFFEVLLVRTERFYAGPPLYMTFDFFDITDNLRIASFETTFIVYILHQLPNDWDISIKQRHFRASSYSETYYEAYLGGEYYLRRLHEALCSLRADDPEKKVIAK